IGNVLRKTQSDVFVPGKGAVVTQPDTTYDRSYTYGARPHAATAVGDTSYTFDADGNQVDRITDHGFTRRHMIYDEEGRLQRIQQAGATCDFLYNADGERTHKNAGAGAVTLYVSALYTVRNGTIGSKNIFVGATRVASHMGAVSNIGRDNT